MTRFTRNLTVFSLLVTTTLSLAVVQLFLPRDLEASGQCVPGGQENGRDDWKVIFVGTNCKFYDVLLANSLDHKQPRSTLIFSPDGIKLADHWTAVFVSLPDAGIDEFLVRTVSKSASLKAYEKAVFILRCRHPKDPVLRDLPKRLPPLKNAVYDPKHGILSVYTVHRRTVVEIITAWYARTKRELPRSMSPP